jgi:hypothetical protein
VGGAKMEKMTYKQVFNARVMEILGMERSQGFDFMSFYPDIDALCAYLRRGGFKITYRQLRDLQKLFDELYIPWPVKFKAE